MCERELSDLTDALQQGGTVASVSSPPSDDGTARTVPGGGKITLRVISRSLIPADVTAEFLFRGMIVHFTQLHVEPLEQTDVVGPDVAEQIHVTGTYAGGEPLTERTFLLGADFEDGGVVIYYVGGEQVNAVPMAIGQSVTVEEDGSVLIALIGSDPDGGPQPLSFAIAGDPVHGALSDFDPNTGSVRYAPDPDYHGADSFRFTVFDGQDTSGPASVTIKVSAVNDPPALEIAAVSLTSGPLRDCWLGLVVRLYDQDDGDPSGALTLRLYAVRADGGEDSYAAAEGSRYELLLFEGPGDGAAEPPGQPRSVVIENVTGLLPPGSYFIKGVLDDGQLQAEDITEEAIAIGYD